MLPFHPNFLLTIFFSRPGIAVNIGLGYWIELSHKSLKEN